MRFYVNQFYDDSIGSCKYPDYKVGLFTNDKWKGEGSFCGYYARECYCNTVLLAWYVAKGGGPVTFTPRISDVTRCDIYKEQVTIGCGMWTMVIEADSIDEAVEKFARGEWRRKRYSDNDITVRMFILDYDFSAFKHARVEIIHDGELRYIYEDSSILAMGPDISYSVLQEGPSIEADCRDVNNRTVNIKLVI